MDASFYEGSDKFFWHRYLSFYEPYFAELSDATQILEFGVFHGDSVRYLTERFKQARVSGADILPVQPEWPQSDRIGYFQMDQGVQNHVELVFANLPAGLDLVIEDGSHQPAHQRNCLVESLQHIRSGGIYILEDLHTSYPEHPLAQEPSVKGKVNSYDLLLAFEHLRSIGREINEREITDLTTNSLFDAKQVVSLFEHTAKVEIYQRAMYPLRCWNCNSSDFNFAARTCSCGEQLISKADSMSAVITVCHP